LPDAVEKAWLLVVVETADRSDIELRYNRDRTKRMQEIIFMPRDDLGRWVSGGNDISPPASGGQPANADEPSKLSPLADDAHKIALLGHHRGRHA
jgi:hypothetical protein